ncbi:D-alanine-D-alanine ligase A [Brucella ovis IntaBari-2006-46-332]|nr:D-alanine--D-alanine ligase family protein [Brucella ovis]ENR03422.1 D-alanine-D-alanine ligase A [Brucella ovis 80/125]ENR08371.1 D-alanine-D-alanine ligase A [Brucella ovis F8/05B]ENS95242.1 D-alanine-D-alanine ligase A [Brucella ovis 63/96]ENS99238.1 D-alanine-D-alanine ligase A [Brucella ovis 81/8]ENT77851.1 D-alanine-D-alanine ligase A [Brucella ovis IntaBari-2009-88-4]
MASGKMRIVVLFGGRSAEHDVSVLSATNVMNALDPAKYEAVPVFVTRAGQWLLSRFVNGALEKPSSGAELCLVPGGCGRAIVVPDAGAPYEADKIDIIFPVLHGLHGEDGAVQGLAQVAQVPLAGCGIPGSANALDKDIAKRLVNEAGLSTAKSVTITREEVPAFSALEQALGLPIFIKPARQGSSVGVHKVVTEADYQAAMSDGFTYDDKLLAEEFIQAREVECGVLEDEGGALFVSRAGEIVPAESHCFYSYDAKYIDADGTEIKVPAELPEQVENEIRAIAAKAFRVLGCDSMARVDFFVTADRRIVLNEINTIPGFTDMSMYSKVMAVSGVSYPEIINRLVAHGLARGS